MRIVKTTLFIIIAFCFSSSAKCQQSGSDMKIKSITVFEQKNDMLINKQYKESETYYDSRGNVLEVINYKSGKINKHFKYQFDSDGNKIKEEELDSSGKIIESSEYKIENGLRVRKIVYDASKKIKSTKIYQYTTF